MKLKIFLLSLFVFLVLSCSNRCIVAMDDARTQNRDTALCYLWRYTNSYRTVTVDSGYYNLRSNGNFEVGSNLKELKYTNKYAWYSLNDSFTYVGCQDNGSVASTTVKYAVNGDSLQIVYPSGAHPRFIKVSKPIP